MNYITYSAAMCTYYDSKILTSRARVKRELRNWKGVLMPNRGTKMENYYKWQMIEENDEHENFWKINEKQWQLLVDLQHLAIRSKNPKSSWIAWYNERATTKTHKNANSINLTKYKRITKAVVHFVQQQRQQLPKTSNISTRTRCSLSILLEMVNLSSGLLNNK